MKTQSISSVSFEKASSGKTLEQSLAIIMANSHIARDIFSVIAHNEVKPKTTFIQKIKNFFNR